MTSFPVPPPTFRLNWGHPRARGIISAYPFIRPAFRPSAASKFVRDLARGPGVIFSGTMPWATDLPGTVWVNGSGSGAGNQLSSFASVYDTTILTLSAVIKTTNTGVISIASRDNTSSTRSWQFRMNAGKLEFLPFLAGTPTTVTGATTISDGIWHHVAATYDRVTIRLYVDGKADGTSAQTAAISSTTCNLAICNTNQTFNDQIWQGSMADFKFWGRVLSPAEVAAEVADPWAIYRTVPRAWLGMPAVGLAFADNMLGRFVNMTGGFLNG